LFTLLITNVISDGATALAYVTLYCRAFFSESWLGTHFGDIWLFLVKCQNQANDKAGGSVNSDSTKGRLYPFKSLEQVSLLT